jgi:hypothetical protein
MEISFEEQQAIQTIIDKGADFELDTLRLRAYCDLEDLSHVLGLRVLTGEEITKFQYSVELITRLDSRKEGGNFSFRNKRRTKLMAYYTNYDRSKSVRGYTM